MQNKAEVLAKLNKIKPIAVILLMPAIFALLFAFTFGEAYVKDIPVVVYDRDASEMSREIAEQLDDSQGLEVIGYVHSMAELENKLLAEEAVAAVIFPENFAADMRAGRNPGVRMLMSGTNLFLGNNCMLAATTVFTTLNIELRMQVFEAKGTVPTDALNYSTTLLVSESMMYNPEMSYMQYLMIGVMAVIVQQLFFLFSGLLFMENRLAAKRLREVVPNICFYLLLSLAGFLMAIIIMREFAGLKMIGNVLLVVLLQSLFLLAITGSSLVFSSLFKNKERFAQFSLFLAVPTFITSTFMWPAYMMPKGMITVIKAIWPLQGFAPAVKGVLQKGMTFTDVSASMLYLLGFAAVWVAAGYLLYTYRVRGAARIA